MEAQTTKDKIYEAIFTYENGDTFIDAPKLKEVLLEIVERIDALYGVVQP